MYNAMAHRFRGRQLQLLQAVKSRLDRGLVIVERPELLPGKARCLRAERQASVGQTDTLDHSCDEGCVIAISHAVDGELQGGGSAVEAQNDRSGCHQWPPPACCCGTDPNALSIRT